MSHVGKQDHTGWLYKWTNYLKGYQRRWFVLNDGGLSYFRSQAEMGHTCRGTISLVNAKIEVYDSLTFVVSNGTAQTYHLRAANVPERKGWVEVLKKARDIAQENLLTKSGDALISTLTMDSTDNDFVCALRGRLNDLETCERMVCRDGEMLLRALSQLEDHVVVEKNTDSGKESLSQCAGMEVPPADILEDYTSLKEKTTVFKVTVNAMVNSLTSFVEFANSNTRHWQRQLSHEKEQRARMERMVEELAKQHSALERKVQNQSVALHRHVQTSDGFSEMRPTSPHSIGGHASQTLQSACSNISPIVAKMSTEGESEEEDAFFDAVSSTETYEADTFCLSVPTQPGPKTSNTSNVDGIELPADETMSCYTSSSDEVDEEDGTTVPELNTNNDLSSLNPAGNADTMQVVRVITRKKQTKSRVEKDSSPKKQASQTREVSPCEVENENESAQFPATIPEESSIVASRQSSPISSSVKQSCDTSSDLSVTSHVPRQRRWQIPPRPNLSVNLWNIMKNCIGKELTKIPVPVNFNEPLSMLQRVVEDYEYSSCLDSAAKCCDSIEQMAYVATFSVTAYSTTKSRTGKPFNPLLGETYECDRRDDFGWRSLVEQVSHHPPVLALHCESASWCSWQEFTVTSKFRGKYLSIVPQGTEHVVFKGSQNHYTWNKVTTTVHNIIVGRLWIDNHGEMDILNHTTGDTCHLSYKPYSYFSRDEPRRVMGIIYDKTKRPRYMLRGTWDAHMEGAPITAIRNNDWETGPWTVLWRKTPDPPNSSLMYNFTGLAIQLNEPEEGVAPTDSRLRPDLRLMEHAKWEEANKEKERLEEKQRAKRKAALHRSSDVQKSDDNVSHVSYEPKWFKPAIDPLTGKQVHLYNGLYWECKENGDWSGCPDIF